jgi:hypothetical protein
MQTVLNWIELNQSIIYIVILMIFVGIEVKEDFIALLIDGWRIE